MLVARYPTHGLERVHKYGSNGSTPHHTATTEGYVLVATFPQAQDVAFSIPECWRRVSQSVGAEKESELREVDDDNSSITHQLSYDAAAFPTGFCQAAIGYTVQVQATKCRIIIEIRAAQVGLCEPRAGRLYTSH